MVASGSVAIHTRLGVWFAEMLLEVALFAPVLVLLFGRSNGKTLADDLVLGLAATAFFFLGSGYWVTTAILAVVLRNRPGWIYAAGCFLLFAGHEQAFVKGWSSPDVSDLEIQFVGGGVIAAVAFAGAQFVRTGLAREESATLTRGGA